MEGMLVWNGLKVEGDTRSVRRSLNWYYGVLNEGILVELDTGIKAYP